MPNRAAEIFIDIFICRLLDGDLTIEKVQLHMEGTYECRASNIMGEIRSKSQLTVGNSTKILSGPSDTKTIEGDTVVMDCKATWDSRYNLNIEWRHDGTHLNADDRHIIGNDSLTINNVNSQDKGMFNIFPLSFLARLAFSLLSRAHGRVLSQQSQSQSR
jgi:hypothetical protein